MKKVIVCMFVAFTVCLSSLPAVGKTVYIPNDYSSIQEGIDAVSDGDSVIVTNGTYTGEGNRNIDLKGKAVTVTSQNGPENCIIDCENAARGFWIHSGEGADSVISGFTIKNGSASDGGGIWCDNDSSPTIDNCIIMDNKAESYGGGILCDNGSSPIISNCIIKGNIGFWGGGIMCHESSSPTIINCVIYKNEAEQWYGGGIYCRESSPSIINCTIVKNKSRYVGGVESNFRPYPTITNCIIRDNSGGIIGGNPEIPEQVGGASATYSNIQYGYSGEGNIDDDPLFVNTENDDYRLTQNSPCIDKGTADNAPATDIDGVSRPQGNSYDMGAYEFGGVLNKLPVANAGADTIVFDNITLDGSLSVDSDGTITSYQWQIKHRENPNYSRTAEGQKTTISNLEKGFYEVTLTVTDNNGATGSDIMLLGAAGFWEINNDYKQGLAEAIYILQILSNIRTVK
ncbi:MAG: hypothetical protein GY795_36820 [Desulfobacterales bacterium]|nr:hypothetical protein [Desulfobacterales bacterium]